MKIYKWIPLFLIIISCGTPQSVQKDDWQNYIHKDENGKQITREEFKDLWRRNKDTFARFDISKDSGRVVTLGEPLYSRYVVKYPEFSKKIEEITGKQFSPTTIFLIEYTYVDDFCGVNSTNNWSTRVIQERKQFTTPIKKTIEKRNPEIAVLNFFETGISLKNSPNSRREYYFQDLNNFLRSAIFLQPSLCGSFAIVKPNGETLVRNGESNAEFSAKHLEPEIWEQLFPSSE